MVYNTREAIINDASQIAEIYNEGIEDRIAKYINQGVLDGKFVNVTIMEMLLV